MAATQAAASDVTVTGATLTWFAPEPSVEYGFCRVCGSSLFWRIVGGPNLSICAGTLEEPTGLRTEKAWWVAEAADYHDRPAGVVENAYED